MNRRKLLKLLPIAIASAPGIAKAFVSTCPPAGYLLHPAFIKKEEVEQLRKAWGQGFTPEEVCRIFRVPMEIIGGPAILPDGTLVWARAELDQILY
jgi:hypothetical protein